MNKIDCPNFNGCDAVLCPLDESSVRHGIWYADEPVCPRRDVPDWVRTQKRIAKLLTGDDGYFTVPMLSAIKQARPGLKGLSPDLEISEGQKAEKAWIRDKIRGRVSHHEIPGGGRVIAEKEKSMVSMTSYVTSEERRPK